MRRREEDERRRKRGEGTKDERARESSKVVWSAAVRTSSCQV